MLEIPASVTAATGMDALTHAVEACNAPLASLTDANALEAFSLINVWLPKAFATMVATSKPVSKWHSASTRRYVAFSSAGWGWFTRWRTSRAQPTTCHGVCATLSCCQLSRTQPSERRRAFCPHRTGDGRGDAVMSTTKPQVRKRLTLSVR